MDPRDGDDPLPTFTSAYCKPVGELTKVKFETSAEFDGDGSIDVMANVDVLMRKDRRWISSDVSDGFATR